MTVLKFDFNLHYLDLILHLQGQASQYLMLWHLHVFFKHGKGGGHVGGLFKIGVITFCQVFQNTTNVIVLTSSTQASKVHKKYFVTQ